MKDRIEKYHLRYSVSLMTPMHNHDLVECKLVTERNGMLVYLWKVAQSIEFSCTLFGAKLIAVGNFCSLRSDHSEFALNI